MTDVPNPMNAYQALVKTREFQNSHKHIMMIGHFGENHCGEHLAKAFENLGWRVCRVGFYRFISDHSIYSLDVCLSSFINTEEVKDYLEHRKLFKVANLCKVMESEFDFVLMLQCDLMFDLTDVNIPAYYYHTEILHPYLPDGCAGIGIAYPGGNEQLMRIFSHEYRSIRRAAIIPHACDIDTFRAREETKKLTPKEKSEEWDKRKYLFAFKGTRTFTKCGDFVQDNIYNLRDQFLPVAEKLGLYYPQDKTLYWTDDFANLMKDTKIALNITGLWGGINQRLYEACASKCILFTNWNEHLEKFGFKDGVNCYTFKDEKEMVEKYKWITEHMEDAKKVAQRGYDYVNANHTYTHRAMMWIILHFETKYQLFLNIAPIIG